MKVLMIAPDINKVPGGMSTVIINYINYNLGDNVDFKYHSSTIEGNILVKILFNLKSVLKFAFIVRNYEIIHIHMAERGSFFRKSMYVLLSKLYKKNVFIHMHAAEFQEFYGNCGNSIQRYIRYIFNISDVVTVLSAEWKEFFLKITKTNIEVLHNAVNVPNKNLYNNNQHIITMMGRLGARKGVYDILSIIEDVANIDKHVKFYMAGDGEVDKVKKIVKEKGLEEYVNILGWVDENKRVDILKNTCIYLLPSYNEGMPMSILEAISYGIPVIASDIGGIPSIIEEGTNGFLIHPGDTNKLKDKIIYLLSNRSERYNISKNNYELALNEFSIKRHIDKLLSIYKSLM